MKSKMKEPSIPILFLIVSFASVLAILYTPALPEIARRFNISEAQAQLSMTLFLFGYAFGNLPYGPLSNRFGRKPVLYWGSIGALIGTLMALLAGSFNSFELFLAGRVLSALGSSVGMKISFTMVGDAFSQTAATKKISIIALSFAITPGLAVMLGGFLTEQLGWESCFYFLCLYSLLLLFLSTFLPETHPNPDPGALNWQSIKEKYLKAICNKKLIGRSLLLTCGTSMIYLFGTLAPFIGINHIGLSPQSYGLLNLIPPVGLLTGYILSHQFAGKKEPMFVILLGVLICVVASTLILLLFAFGDVTAWSLFLPMPLLYLGIAMVYSTTSALTMSHAHDKSTTSSIMNFVNMGGPCLMLFVGGLIPAQWTLGLPVLLFGLSFLSFILERRLK